MIELAFELDALRAFVRSRASLCHRPRLRDDVDHATAGHDEIPAGVAARAPVERVHPGGELIEAGDAHTGLRRAGVTLRTEHDVDVRPLAEAQRLLRNVLGEATLAERVHESREIALDPRERDLRLGIAEAQVTLDRKSTRLNSSH